MEIRGGSGAVEDALHMPGIDAWVYSRPHREARAGGDVHYLSTCATGRIARVLVADVSGHGIKVGPVAQRLHDLMTQYVNFVDQRRFFGALNRRFGEMLEGGMFATAVVMTYFAPTGRLSISNAGHPPPLLWRGRSRQWSFVQSQRAGGRRSNMPLGVIDAARYDQFDLSLDVEDLVLCYTDGLNESRDPQGQLLSMEGLLRVAGGIDGSRPEDVVHAFTDAIASLHEGNLTADDVTLLAFQPNGGSQKVSLRNRLAAPFRVSAAALSAAVGGGPIPWPELSITNLGGAMIDRLNHWKHGSPPE
jgi:serine phosphatase RsbU (regulator of sigma subunit)